MRTIRLAERLAVAAGAVALAMVLFGGVGSAHGAAVQVTPSQAAAGATITITGTGFIAGDMVTVTLESALAQTSLGTATADQNESWTLMATVPASEAAGAYMVRATNAAAGGDDDTTGDLTVTAAAVAQTSQSTDQSAAQPTAQTAIVHERTTAEDVIVGLTFGGLAIIGLILILASRVHGIPGSSAGSKPLA
jgi:hypothetical protein